MSREGYVSPFSTRYASPEMQHVFSDDFKFTTWRRLWVALAKAEHALGLDVTQEQIDEMQAHVNDVNYDVAEAREREVRHDVMSHVYAFGKQCPKAEPIIHLGATSCYVGDNTDVIILREASKIVLSKAAAVLKNLAGFAEKYKDMPCLAYTHLQPAQLTTVGKRATLWMYDLVNDVENLEFQISRLKLLGSKGTTGTQASFMELFDGDEEKILRMEQMIAEDVHFARPRDGRLRHFGRFVGISLAKRNGLLALQELFKLFVVEPKLAHLKASVLQGLQLGLQKRLVPFRDLARLVVGDAQRVLLLRREMIDNHGRDRFRAEFLHGLHPGVAVDDDLVLVQDDRPDEAELPNRRDDSRDGLVVHPRIVGIGRDLRKLHVHYFHTHLSIACPEGRLAD